MNGNPYQSPSSLEAAARKKPRVVDYYARQRRLRRDIKLDTANLGVWLFIYIAVAYVLKGMIDTLTPNYEYPILRIIVVFVAPGFIFVLGIVGNLLVLNSQRLGKTLAFLRLGLSAPIAVVSVPIFGYDSQLTLAQNVISIFLVGVVCLLCLYYYHLYRNTIQEYDIYF